MDITYKINKGKENIKTMSTVDLLVIKDIIEEELILRGY